MPTMNGGMMAPVEDDDDMPPQHAAMGHHERVERTGHQHHAEATKQQHGVDEPIVEAHHGDDDAGATGFVTKVRIGMIIRKWKVVSKIGAGSFGETFAGVEVAPVEEDALAPAGPLPSSSSGVHEKHGHREVCIKVEQESKNVLRLEVLALKKAQPCPQVVRYIASGRCADANYMVMERLGPNLVELRRTSSRGVFSIYTMLKVGISCVQAIKGVHELGLLHRDIKPSNFVIGLEGDAARTCFLIDFGLARRYRRSNGDVRAPRDDAGFRGTSRYASLRSHQHLDLGRVDDLWSLLFMLIEFATGTLPWRKYKEKDDIGRCKQETIGPALVKNLPREFAAVLDHLQSVAYATAPKYDLIIALLQHALERRGYPPGKLLDWEDQQQQQQQLLEGEHHRHDVGATSGADLNAAPPLNAHRPEHEQNNQHRITEESKAVHRDQQSEGSHHSDGRDACERCPSKGDAQSPALQQSQGPGLGSHQRPGVDEEDGDSADVNGDDQDGGAHSAALGADARPPPSAAMIPTPPKMFMPVTLEQQRQPLTIESAPASVCLGAAASSRPGVDGASVSHVEQQQLFPDFDDGCEALFVLQPSDRPQHQMGKLGATEGDDDALEHVSRCNSGSQRTADSGRSGDARVRSKSGALQLEHLSVRLSSNAHTPCKPDISPKHHVFAIPPGATIVPASLGPKVSSTHGPRGMHPIPPTQHTPGVVEEGRTSSTSGFAFSPRDETLDAVAGAPPAIMVPLPVVSVTRHRPVARDARHKEYANPMPPTALHHGDHPVLTSVVGQAVPSVPNDPTGVDGDPPLNPKEETACSCTLM